MPTNTRALAALEKRLRAGDTVVRNVHLGMGGLRFYAHGRDITRLVANALRHDERGKKVLDQAGYDAGTGFAWITDHTRAVKRLSRLLFGDPDVLREVLETEDWDRTVRDGEAPIVYRFRRPKFEVGDYAIFRRRSRVLITDARDDPRAYEIEYWEEHGDAESYVVWERDLSRARPQ